MTETFYDRLGVAEDATTEEIETAYRERLKETHPDLNPDDDANEETRAVIRAREVLTDDAERRRYDRLGHDRYVARSNDATSTTDAASTDDGGTSTQDGRRDGRETARRKRASGRDRSTGRRRTGRRERRTGQRPGNGRNERTSRQRRRGRRRDDGQRRSRNGPDPGEATATETETDPDDGETADETTDDRATDDDPWGDFAGTVWETDEGGDDRRDEWSADRSAGTATDWNASRSTGTADDWSADRTTSVAADWEPWASDQAYTISGEYHAGGYHPSRLFPPEQSLVLIGIVTMLYPVLVASSLFPPFPLVVNVVVGICTVLTVGYMLSLPAVGAAVFGFWALATPLVLLALPSVGLFSLVGTLALLSTWIPFGFSLLLLTVTRGIL